MNTGNAERKLMPAAAFIFSLLLCGLGQLYNGKWKRSAFFFLTSLFTAVVLILSGAVFTFAGGIAVILVPTAVTFASAVDAAVYAVRKKGVPIEWFNRAVIYVCAIVTGLLLTSVMIDFTYGKIMRGYNVIVPTASMIPGIAKGDRLVCSLDTGRIERGDIVIVRFDNRIQIKRIIAFAGDVFAVDKGKVYLNGNSLDEPYAQGVTYYRWNRKIDGMVPKGYCVVLCDNRENGYDSRDSGYVMMENVLGKAHYIYLSHVKENIGKSLIGKK